MKFYLIQRGKNGIIPFSDYIEPIEKIKAENVMLAVKVVEARNLKVADINTSDPYCVLKLNEIEQKTRVIDSNLKDGDSSIVDKTWLLSTRIDDTGASAFNVRETGYLSGSPDVTSLRSVRPVVYLINNIEIESGTGEVGSPYVIKKAS